MMALELGLVEVLKGVPEVREHLVGGGGSSPRSPASRRAHRSTW
jgi:hypothetical protein